MELLHFLADLRNGVLDVFFSTITHLGEETFFIVLGLIFFWCVNKREGYYMLSIGFIGTILNQFLKLWFRIPRPWVKDPDFKPIESAIAEATGYSFPSGHTQSSVGVFGGLARWNKNKILRIICIAICVLVPFSRLYLGVHTLLDVGVSIVIALVLIFGLYPIVHKACDNENIMRVLLGAMVLLSAGYLLFVSLYKFPSDVDIENLNNGTKNAYKMFGCTLGIFISHEIDIRFINFETKATVSGQVLKLLIGVIPLLIIKEGLRVPLSMIFSGYSADFVRYFLIVIFAGCVWPLTFKWFSRLEFKKHK